MLLLAAHPLREHVWRPRKPTNFYDSVPVEEAENSPSVGVIAEKGKAPRNQNDREQNGLSFCQNNTL